MNAPARYFPVIDGPLEMRAGLFRLGTDCGNGNDDGRFFLVDAETPHYLEEKSRVLGRSPERMAFTSTDRAALVNAHVLSWMSANVRIERASADDLEATCRDLTTSIAEDFVVLARGDDGPARVTLVSVCFPSGWRPEAILGLDFLGVHRAVPAFGAVAKASEELVTAMLTKGPYVRFVWTVCPDAELDHHPDRPRARWSDTDDGFLRVERQVTVPFPDLRASLFLVRTFCYAFATLSGAERERLSRALFATSAEVLAYKGLLVDRDEIVRRLEL